MSYEPPLPVLHDPADFPQLPPAVPYRRAARVKFQDTVWKHVALLVLTVLSTTYAGNSYYLSFVSNFGRQALRPEALNFWHGLWYSASILLILGAHEMGHYLACRRYNIDASLPYFIPVPLPMTGTLGAVIQIREPFPTRTILFDIGVAGPIAGFVVLVPVLVWGLMLSQIVPIIHIQDGLGFGESLLFKGAAYLVLGPIRDGQMLNAHPMVFAAWFGMFATSLNLLPFGQFDGGHLTHSAIPRYSKNLSYVTFASAAVMCFFSSGWWAMTAIMGLMLWKLGAGHPRVMNEYEPLGPGRIAVGVFAIVMLVLCFTAVPLEMLGAG